MIINEKKKQYVDNCAEEYRKLLESRVKLLKMKGYNVDINVTYSSEIEILEDDENIEPEFADVYNEYATCENKNTETEKIKVTEDVPHENDYDSSEVDDIFGFDDEKDDALMKECEKILGKRGMKKIKKESEAYPQKIDGSFDVTIKDPKDSEDDGISFYLSIIPEEDVTLDEAIKYTEKERKKILKELDYVLKHGLDKAALRFTANEMIKQSFFIIKIFGFLLRWGKVVLIILLVLLLIGAGLLTYFNLK